LGEALSSMIQKFRKLKEEEKKKKKKKKKKREE